MILTHLYATCCVSKVFFLNFCPQNSHSNLRETRFNNRMMAQRERKFKEATPKYSRKLKHSASPRKRVRMSVSHMQLHQSRRLTKFTTNGTFLEISLFFDCAGASSNATTTVAIMSENDMVFVVFFVQNSFYRNFGSLQHDGMVDLNVFQF